MGRLRQHRLPRVHVGPQLCQEKNRAVKDPILAMGRHQRAEAHRKAATTRKRLL